MAKTCEQPNCQFYHNKRGCPSCVLNPDSYVAKLQAKVTRLEEELVQQKEYVAAISNQFSKSVMATQQFYYPKSICKNLPPEQFSGFNACLSCPMVETCRLLYKRKENEK